MVRRALMVSRYMTFVAVMGSWLASLLTLGFGVYEIVSTLPRVITAANDKLLKSLTVNLIEGVDLFLLSTAFYIIALGLFELFVDERLDLPNWLVLRDLDDLKNKLLKVIVVVIGVQYVGQVLDWSGGMDILYLGVGSGLVIAALAFFLSPKDKGDRKALAGALYGGQSQEKS